MDNRKKERSKRIWSISGILVVVIVIVSAIIYSININMRQTTPITSRSQVTFQNGGDDFILRYVTDTFPEHRTSIYIFTKDNKMALYSYIITGDFEKPDISLGYNTNGLKCYEFSSNSVYFIAYQATANGSKFKIYSEQTVSNNDFSDTNMLYPVAKELFMTKNWNRVKLFGELLLKCNDTEAKATLQRYARGLFTDEEMMQNRGSPITSSDVQEYAAKLISKYP